MKEFIFKFGISNIISILALFLTLYQLINNYFKKRERFEIIANNVQVSDDKVWLSATILNNAESALNITRIYFINNSKEYLCSLKRTMCAERYYPLFPETDIPRTERIFSADFPISLYPKGAINTLIEFKIDGMKKIEKNQTIQLKVVTNKKTKIFNIKCLDNQIGLKYL